MYAADNNLKPGQTQAGLDKLAKMDLSENANVTKAFIEWLSRRCVYRRCILSCASNSDSQRYDRSGN